MSIEIANCGGNNLEYYSGKYIGNDEWNKIIPIGTGNQNLTQIFVLKMYRGDYYTKGYGEFIGQDASLKNKFWFQTLYDVVWGQSPALQYGESLDAFTDYFNSTEWRKHVGGPHIRIEFENENRFLKLISNTAVSLDFSNAKDKEYYYQLFIMQQ